NIVSFDTSSPYYPVALELRYRILRQPLGLAFTPEELEKDKHDTHFALLSDEEELISCITLSFCNDGRVKMRQVATKKEFQNRGFGKMLTTYVENFAKGRGYTIIFCHARKTAISFYERLGYKIVSNEFIEVGIPHFKMEKKL
ncbi:MAG: GNAT family N-acetyltransferase, partial [Chitinophagales bacterium]|nr:GNAT family N-acetyltransferase [Chitinophagales bacterium]